MSPWTLKLSLDDLRRPVAGVQVVLFPRKPSSASLRQKPSWVISGWRATLVNYISESRESVCPELRNADVASQMCSFSSTWLQVGFWWAFNDGREVRSSSQYWWVRLLFLRVPCFAVDDFKPCRNAAEFILVYVERRLKMKRMNYSVIKWFHGGLRNKASRQAGLDSAGEGKVKGFRKARIVGEEVWSMSQEEQRWVWGYFNKDARAVE